MVQGTEQLIGAEMMRKFEKDVMLQVLDTKWKEHLAAMDYLRQSIGLRGYAQKNPKQEYKREAFEMFQQMLEEIKKDTISFLCQVQFRSAEDVTSLESAKQETPAENLQLQHAQADDILHPGAVTDASGGDESVIKQKPIMREGRKIGRNEPCYCGSGKKFKHCHGKLS